MRNIIIRYGRVKIFNQAIEVIASDMTAFYVKGIYYELTMYF